MVDPLVPGAPEVMFVRIRDSEKSIEVVFCLPDKKPQTNGGRADYLGGWGSSPIIDAQANKTPDYSLPAIEPPRPRQSTPYGVVEQPRSEPPRSAFDQGGKTDWMK